MSRKHEHTSGALPGNVFSEATLLPVTVGLPVAGLVTLWTEDGPTLWGVPEFKKLAELVGAARFPRTRVAAGRYRESALLDAVNGVLVVPRLLGSAPDLDGDDRRDDLAFALDPQVHLDGDAWTSLADQISRMTTDAFARGEALVAEIGRWDTPARPYCLVASVEQRGRATVMVETSPARGQGAWPPSAAVGRP